MVVLPEGTDRRRLIAGLIERGVETNLGAQGLHMLGYYRRRYGYAPMDFPCAAELFVRGLALPLHPGLSHEEVAHVARSLAEELGA
jgi:dTDP-4-amino-4,6-dideoxygalactose transaminase